MALELKDIDPESDFPLLSRCIIEAYEDPPQRFFHIYVPIHGSRTEDREAAIDEVSTRLHLWHTQDPSSHWQKVIDVQNGRIVGGAAWNIYKENPFEEPHELEVTWFPDDSSRKFVEKALESQGAPRYRAAQKPHIYLFNVFTHPEYRRRGVGQLLMDWGHRKADELGLEIFLDATLPGKPLYEANGYLELEENVSAPKTENLDREWLEIEKKVSPFTFWLMMRPVGGSNPATKTNGVMENSVGKEPAK